MQSVQAGLPCSESLAVLAQPLANGCPLDPRLAASLYHALSQRVAVLSIASSPGRVCLAGESLDWIIGGPSVVGAIELRFDVGIGFAGEFELATGEPLNMRQFWQGSTSGPSSTGDTALGFLGGLGPCVDTALQAGAPGAKLTDSGMGRCVFALCEEARAEAIVPALKNLPVQSCICSFTALGTARHLVPPLEFQ